jgi:hypothetical protein
MQSDADVEERLIGRRLRLTRFTEDGPLERRIRWDPDIPTSRPQSSFVLPQLQKRSQERAVTHPSPPLQDPQLVRKMVYTIVVHLQSLPVRPSAGWQFDDDGYHVCGC